MMQTLTSTRPASASFTRAPAVPQAAPRRARTHGVRTQALIPEMLTLGKTVATSAAAVGLVGGLLEAANRNSMNYHKNGVERFVDGAEGGAVLGGYAGLAAATPQAISALTGMSMGLAVPVSLAGAIACLVALNLAAEQRNNKQ